MFGGSASRCLPVLVCSCRAALIITTAGIYASMPLHVSYCIGSQITLLGAAGYNNLQPKGYHQCSAEVQLISGQLPEIITHKQRYLVPQYRQYLAVSRALQVLRSRHETGLLNWSSSIIVKA